MARRSAAARARGPVTMEEPRENPTIALPDGGTAELRGEALEIRDREGCLLVRYADGMAEISAPRGDLRLSAPSGRVVLQSGLDVAIEAGRDVVQAAGRSITLSAAARERDPQVRLDHTGAEIKADRLNVQAESSRAVVGKVTLLAHAIATTADRIAVNAGDYERMAERVTERAKDSFREIVDLAEERVGRVRALVRGVYSLSSRRTVMTSTDDTSIDGSRILLG
jgi:Protein of unknown function (DUF3540)